MPMPVNRKKIRTESRIHLFFRKHFPNVNAKPLFLFGNQKSGTTAIAALLAIYGRLPVTLDIGGFKLEEQDDLHACRLDIGQFIQRHKFEFSASIIKEPALTFLYDHLKNYFKLSKSVFIIRDPRDNTRSILNRVKVDGKAANNPDYCQMPPLWQRIVDNRWLGLDYDFFIDSLAARWNLAADVYLNHPDDFVLVKYEDFVKQKIETIETLARAFSMEKKTDITPYIDVQFQPAGMKSVQWKEFFGQENLNRIEEICKERMAIFNY